MNKIGRPLRSGEPRDRRISLRTTQSVQDRLRHCAELTGKTQSELLEEMVNQLFDSLEEAQL